MNLFDVEQLAVMAGQKPLLSIDYLTLPSKKLTAIIGSNGAGKSTLLHALLGCHHGATGKISCQNQPVSAIAKQGKIAWVGQHEKFSLPLTVIDYVLLGATVRLGFYAHARTNDRQFAQQLLAEFDLDTLADKRIERLSGGEKQRMAVVRALIQRPEILLFDEPSNHLDIKYERLLFGYLRQLVDTQQKSVVVVVHSLTHAYAYADHIVALKNGGVVASGDKDRVMTPQQLNQLYDAPIYRYDTPSGAVFV